MEGVTAEDMANTAIVLLRWLHFLAGIMWIGLLYFFNFVNGPFAKTMDGPTKQKVVPELMPRALWWFRWGAMFTFLSGLGMIFLKYLLPVLGEDEGLLKELMTSPKGQWISFGAAFGAVMWFNVWFVIWPKQRKLGLWAKREESPPEMAGMVKTATMASKVNTYFSGPMLFGMLAGSHAEEYSIGLVGENPMWLLIALAVGFGAIHVGYMVSARIKGAQ